jgi:endonuclease YncB( thermonuclease family)
MMSVRLLAYAVVILAAGLLASQTMAAQTGCPVAPEGGIKVAAIGDGRTLLLADRTEVRLAGLEDIAHAGDVKVAAAAALQAKSELERLAQGRMVAVISAGEDRYGRRVAWVAAADQRNSPLLQEQLIARGYGLAAARAELNGCVSRLLAAERSARSAHLGLWANPRYLVRDADRPGELLAEARGRFAVVEGTVLSVNDRGATVYVNFGRRWSEDFTVTIAKRNVRKFIAAGLDPKALAGRRVRVRGWVDERGGPWIEAVGPGQVEFAN